MEEEFDAPKAIRGTCPCRPATSDQRPERATNGAVHRLALALSLHGMARTPDWEQPRVSDHASGLINCSVRHRHLPCHPAPDLSRPVRPCCWLEAGARGDQGHVHCSAAVEQHRPVLCRKRAVTCQLVITSRPSWARSQSSGRASRLETWARRARRVMFGRLTCVCATPSSSARHGTRRACWAFRSARPRPVPQRWWLTRFVPL